MVATLQRSSYTLSPGEGANLQVRGANIRIKASSEQTGGVFNLFEVTYPPGYATSLHIHYTEDVEVYVLDGALEFFWGSEKMQAPAGSFFYQPRGTPHGFRVQGSQPVRALFLTIPAGFDQYLREQDGRSLDLDEASAARYKIENMGPLPE